MERVVPEQTTEDPKDLRTKLDKALKELADTKAELTPLQHFKTITEAGYSHLNEHQQKALFSSFGENDTIDSKAIKDAAKNLGFQPAPTVPPTVPNPNNGQVQNPGQFPGQVPGVVQDPNQIPGQVPGQIPTQYPGQMPTQVPGQIPGQVPGQPYQQFVPEGQLPPIPGVVPNPQQQAYEAQMQQQMIADGIQGLSAAEYANVMATRQGRTGDSAFSQAINQAQTPEQVMGVIATQGKGVGVVLESDID